MVNMQQFKIIPAQRQWSRESTSDQTTVTRKHLQKLPDASRRQSVFDFHYNKQKPNPYQAPSETTSAMARATGYFSRPNLKIIY